MPAMLVVVLVLLLPASSAASPTWLVPTTIAPEAGAARIAVDPAGDAVAVWSALSGGKTVIQAWNRPANAHFVPVTLQLSSPGTGAFDPEVALDKAGNAYASFSSSHS